MREKRVRRENNQPRLDFKKRTCLMGILNVTPDSFSDGGIYLDIEKAITRATEIARDGADIVDVGGESTRPGSLCVSEEEELRRVLPVIRGIKERTDIAISIDTSKPGVAKEALSAGASIINNIMGTPLDRHMAFVAAKYNSYLVLMHIKGTPKKMQDNPEYSDVVSEIVDDLRRSVGKAVEWGVSPDKIIVDPGIGFGKTARHNLEILRRLSELKTLDKPILVGPSRKSFIGSVTGVSDPKDRIMGTAAAIAVSIANGANCVRVHDIKEMKQVSVLTNRVYQCYNHS